MSFEPCTNCGKPVSSRGLCDSCCAAANDVNEAAAITEAIVSKPPAAKEQPNRTEAQRLFDALKSITEYDSVKQVRRCASPMGLDEDEALEMAYENVISEAKAAIYRMRRPK